MTNLKIPFLMVLIVIVSAGCTKTNVLDDPPIDPLNPPSNIGKPTGILYVDYLTDFVKINANDSSVIWKSTVVNMAGSATNPMAFDSTTFYHGNASGLTAYSSQTGVPRWYFHWGSASGAVTYREPAFKDSLLFVTSPTSFLAHASLYCLSKKTGTMKWKKQIDTGYPTIPFNAIPMVVDDKVIVLTRDVANHIRLAAFETTGSGPSWTSDINDSLSFFLKIKDKKIYSTTRKTVFCYNASDGSLLWKKDLQLNDFTYTSTFFEQDKLIVVKVLGKNYTVFVLNAANGNEINRYTLTVPTDLLYPANAPQSCNYYNNTLIVTSHHNLDSVSIKSYDLTRQELKWEKRFAHYYYDYFNPLLTDKYLIFPINSTWPDEKSILYFFDLNGRQVTGIPLATRTTDGCVYNENGMIYTLNNLYIGRF